MREGVKKDLERQARKERNILLLKEQQELEKQLSKRSDTRTH